MHKKSNRLGEEYEILISGHLPPPMGGIAMFYQLLLASSLPDRITLQFVQTSSQKRALSESGSLTLLNLWLAVLDCLRFLKAVVNHRPQIAHIATAPGFSFLKHSLCVFISKISGSQVLIHPHCSFDALYSDKSNLWKWYIRKIFRLCDGMIAISKEWINLNEILPELPVYILPNAIDLSLYSAIARDRFQKKEYRKCKNILYLGYVGQAKGSYDLVDAAGKLNKLLGDFQIDLVGDELVKGDIAVIRDALEKNELMDKVHVHGPVYGVRKKDFLENADIFVYPSYHEGMPIAVIEAMASGLPIVATNVGGLPDLVIDGQNGLLVESGNADQLMDAIHELIINSDLRFSMQLESFRIAKENHDIEKLVNELIKIYNLTLHEQSI